MYHEVRKFICKSCGYSTEEHHIPTGTERYNCPKCGVSWELWKNRGEYRIKGG